LDDGVLSDDDAEVDEACSEPSAPYCVPCQDGRWCNGPERCNSYCECEPPGPPISCDDGDPSTSDWCDEDADMCRHDPAD
jgi:hypothetical protein